MSAAFDATTASHREPREKEEIVRRSSSRVLILAAIGSLACAPGAIAGDAGGPLVPLPASDYSVHAACPPAPPRSANCMALELVPQSAQARAHRHPLGMRRSRAIRAGTPAEEAFGLRPADLHSAYALPVDAPGPQTIALVDAYNDPSAEADLKAYDEAFGLPACTKANGCFSRVNQDGAATPLPVPASTGEVEQLEEHGYLEEAALLRGWIFEISLDIEIAHATCENCHILLVEAESSEDVNLNAAERTAERLGASEISNSWGGPEVSETPRLDEQSPFDDPGVVITAATGDDGYLNWQLVSGSQTSGEREATERADYPASSPHVIAVGGTRLELAGGAWANETVWNDRWGSRTGATSGGCSLAFAAPAWQQALAEWPSVGCGAHRAVADVAADADPQTGAAIYDSTEACGYSEAPHWCTVGGTSLSSPLIAGVFALAGGAHGVAYPAQTLYERAAAVPGLLHDVRAGSNGKCTTYGAGGLPTCSDAQEAEASKCSGLRICLAAPGYDGPTGLGTPDGIGAFQPPVSESGGTTGPAGPAPEISDGRGPTLSTTGSSAAIPELSALTLTRAALLALADARSRVGISAVAFSFILSMPAKVRVTLAKRVVSHGRRRWQTLPDSLTVSGAGGRDHARLSARGRLAPGLYLLTLTPAPGLARSITLRVG